MTGKKDFFSGASVIADTQDNIVSTNQKSRIAVSNPYAMPIRATMSFGGNGIILADSASTDLHLVSDDLSAGGNWVSRSGGFTANHTGSPTVGLETALYPSGGFVGTGYRTSVADFTTSKYYKLGYNAAHAITATSTVTYEMLIRVGVIATEESFWARYITALTKYNLRIYTKDDGSNNYRLYVEVDHATTNATCIQLVTQMSTLLLTFTYDGPSKVLTMYLNGRPVTTGSGNVGAATGSGAVSTDTSTDLWIGLTDTVVGKPLVKGQILEVMRHQSVLSAATILQRFQTMSGMQLPDGTFPSQPTIHNSFGFIPVNNKVWAFTRDWPMMNADGILCNVSYGCTMYSTAVTDGSGGASNLTITAGCSLASETNSINSQINGQSINIPYSGILDSSSWFNFGLNQSVKSACTVVWRGINSAVAYLYIYDETTLKYWVSGTTWSLVPTAIDLSSFIIRGTGTLTDPYISNVPFTTEAFGAGFHRIDAVVHNNLQLDATKSLKIYWCQISDSGQFAAEPLVAIHPTGGDSTVFLGTQFQYPASIINWNVGQINFDFKPVFSSTQPRLSPSNAQTQLSGNSGNNFLQENIGSSTINFKDNAAHNAFLSPTFANYELLQFQLNWNNGNSQLRHQITNKALSSVKVFTAPLSIGDFRIGTSSQSPGGYIKSVIIR